MPKKCTHCGAELDDNAVVCSACNTKVEGDASDEATDKKKNEKIAVIIGVVVVVLVIVGLIFILRGCSNVPTDDNPTGYTIGETYRCCNSSLRLEKVQAYNSFSDLPEPEGNWVYAKFTVMGERIPCDEFQSYIKQGKITLGGTKAYSYEVENSYGVDLQEGTLYIDKGSQFMVFFDLDDNIRFYEAELVVEK